MSEAFKSGQILLREEPKAGDARLTRLKLHASTGKGILKDWSWDFMNRYRLIHMKIDLNRKIDYLNLGLTLWSWTSPGINCKVRTIQSGRSKQEGVCFMINNQQYSDVEIISMGCSPDLEHLMIRCRPYYLLRESTSFILTAVYIPPNVDTSPGRAVWGYRQDRVLTARGCFYWGWRF